MTTSARVGTLVLLAAGGGAATPLATASPGPGASPTAAAVVAFEVHRILRRGDAVRVDLDLASVVEAVEVQWDDRDEGARASFLVDGITVARRYVGDHEREVIEVNRAGAELVIKIDRAAAGIDTVFVRYAAACPCEPGTQPGAEPPPPPQVSWLSDVARVVRFHRDLKSGDRLRIPAAFSGMKVREVRVRATATDFRGRLKLEGGGLDPMTQIVARNDTAVFPTKGVPDDTQDLTLVMDFRGALVEDVTILYDAPPEPPEAPPRAPGAPAPHAPPPVPAPRPVR